MTAGKTSPFRFVYFAALIMGLCQLSANAQTDRGAEVNTAVLDAVQEIGSTGYSDVELKKSYRKSSPVLVTRFRAKITLYPKKGYFDVEESYDVLFNVQKHGIYRNIPLVYRMDDSQTARSDKGFWVQQPRKHRIEIEDVQVPGHTAKVSGGRFSGTLNIRIGDADKYVNGPQKYRIKYRVKDAFLFDEDAGYFYWNLMGNQWAFPFLESSFEVYLPENPDANCLVYTGFQGDTTSRAEHHYQNGVFSGKATEILGSGKGMTLLIRLPVDYITRPTAFKLWWRDYGWVIFPPLAFLLFFMAWYAWGRDNKPVKMVEYFPPKGMDPALAGYLADEDADTRDLTALIPYWGAQGILTMEIDKASLPVGREKKNKFFNIKSEHIPKIVLGGIYLFGLVFGLTIIVKSGFEVFWSILGAFGSFLPFVIIATILIYKSMRSNGSESFTLHKKKELSPDSPLYEHMMFNGLFSNRNSVSTEQLKASFYTTLSKAKSELLGHSAGMYFTKYSKRNIIITGITCVLAGIVGGIGIAIWMSILGGVLFLLTCIGLCCYAGLMRKRLVEGDEMLQKVEGFRMFIQKAKKNELKWLLNENLNYFEDTLAYAVAFGFVEKYSKKFEGLVQASPHWYSGNTSGFTMSGFSNSFHSAMRSTASTLVSRPAPSGSSGGFSGGGSSGGGFGGGGGGSW